MLTIKEGLVARPSLGASFEEEGEGEMEKGRLIMKRFCCQHCGGTAFFEISSMPLFGADCKERIPVILRRHHNGPRVLVRQHQKAQAR